MTSIRNTIYLRSGQIGGTENVDVDAINGNLLKQNDIVFVKDTVGGVEVEMVMRVNLTGGAAESVPSVVVPDTNPGTINFELMRLLVNGIQIYNDSRVIDDKKLSIGTGEDYWVKYNSASTRFELWTNDSDGGGTDKLLFSIADGGTTAVYHGIVEYFYKKTFTGGGTANAHTVTTGFSLSSLSTDFHCFYTAPAANTGSVTCNVDGIGVKTLKTPRGDAIVAGQITSGMILHVWYDGTDLIVLSPLAFSTQGTVNLIRNPFGAMSQGTQVDHPDASNLMPTSCCTDPDDDQDNTTGWTALSSTLHSEAGGNTGNRLEINNSGAAAGYATKSFATVIGRVYKFSYYHKGDQAGGSGADVIGYARLGTTDGSNDIYASGTLSNAAWTAYNVTFKATTATTYCRLQCNSAVAADYTSFDDVTLYEQTRACTGADTKSFDLWSKQTTLDVYRIVAEDQFTSHREYYGAKSVPSAQNDWGMFIGGDSDAAAWLAKWSGQVVVQAKVISSTADDFKIRIWDSVNGATYSSAHSGGGAEETLEVSATIADAAANVSFGWFHTNASPGDAYITDFQISFGSYIGEGNYVPPPPHYVPFETPVQSAHSWGSYSDSGGWVAYDLEIDSGMAIPANAKGMQARFIIRDFGSATNDTWFGIYDDGYTAQDFRQYLGGVLSDNYRAQTARLRISDPSAWNYRHVASASNTLDANLSYCGVDFD